jgi:hypothetical protein
MILFFFTQRANADLEGRRPHFISLDASHLASEDFFLYL